MSVDGTVLAVDGRPVLVALRALGLGDLLTGLPALRALDQAFPGYRRLLATDPALEPLVRLAGVADEVVPARGLAPGPALPARPQVAVNLHGRGPQSTGLLAALRPHQLIAFASARVPQTAGLPAWRAEEHEVDRWCRLLGECGIAARPDRLELAVDAPYTGATVVHPGAGAAARRWPAERWAEVARRERLGGRPVVVTGGPAEVDLAESVASAAGLPATAVAAGRTDVLDLAKLVAGAGLVLSADTGVAHLATATHTPSVVIFGPTPPSLWGPPPGRPMHTALWAGRRGDPLAGEADPGLLRVGVDDVVDAIAALRARLAGSARETG